MQGAKLALFSAAAIAAAQSPIDWPYYGHDPGGSQYSPLKQINTGNVNKLRVAWTYDTRPEFSPILTPSAPAANSSSGSTPPSEPPRRTPARNRASQSTPLVVGGVMYLSTPYGHVVALDAETGKKIWELRPPTLQPGVESPIGLAIVNCRHKFFLALPTGGFCR